MSPRWKAGSMLPQSAIPKRVSGALEAHMSRRPRRPEHCAPFATACRTVDAARRTCPKGRRRPGSLRRSSAPSTRSSRGSALGAQAACVHGTVAQPCWASRECRTQAPSASDLWENKCSFLAAASASPAACACLAACGTCRQRHPWLHAAAPACGRAHGQRLSRATRPQLRARTHCLQRNADVSHAAHGLPRRLLAYGWPTAQKTTPFDEPGAINRMMCWKAVGGWLRVVPFVCLYDRRARAVRVRAPPARVRRVRARSAVSKSLSRRNRRDRSKGHLGIL
eukprot:3550769-Prymnesium_polylepis.1